MSPDVNVRAMGADRNKRNRYYYAGGQRIAMRAGGVVYWLHGDHLGSATLTTGASGNWVGEARYTPYGEMRRDYPRGVIPTDRRYTGQRQETFGLYDYQARYYSPGLGRFVSADTLVPSPGKPQTLNRYAYAGNNPIIHNDPDGHSPWLVLAAVLVAVLLIPGDTGPYENTEMNQAIGDLALSVAWEPYDWATTGAWCAQGKCKPLDYAGFLPLIPALGKIDDVVGAARTADRLDDAADALKGAERAGSEITEEGAETVARGGTYRLVDPTTGEVQYVGRTNDLARREAEHWRDPIKGQLRFEVDWRTDDYAVRRGREQMLYEHYRPPLNRIRPISPRNPRLQEYLDAAWRFEERMQ